MVDENGNKIDKEANDEPNVGPRVTTSAKTTTLHTAVKMRGVVQSVRAEVTKGVVPIDRVVGSGASHAYLCLGAALFCWITLVLLLFFLVLCVVAALSCSCLMSSFLTGSASRSYFATYISDG